MNTAANTGEIDGTPGNNDVPGLLGFWTTADAAASPTRRLDIDSVGRILAYAPLGGIGYTTGAGGTVTPATSKSTGVTLDKVVGEITMHNAALAGDATVSFVLTNSAIAANDLLLLQHQSVGAFGSYLLNGRCAAGSATIDVRNITTGSLGEAIVIRYAVLKGAIA